MLKLGVPGVVSPPTNWKARSVSAARIAIESLARQQRMVGWREWVSLPDLRIDRIKAKVDTGARTSALHAVRIEPFDRDGEQWVSFVARPRAGGAADRTAVYCQARTRGLRNVKNSNGGTELRYVIMARLDIGTQRLEIEITLTNRAEMGHEMLLGRTALRLGRFLVHPSKSHLLGNEKPPNWRVE